MNLLGDPRVHELWELFLEELVFDSCAGGVGEEAYQKPNVLCTNLTSAWDTPNSSSEDRQLIVFIALVNSLPQVMSTTTQPSAIR